MIGTVGRALDTRRAVKPDSVSAMMSFAPTSRAMLHATRAAASLMVLPGSEGVGSQKLEPSAWRMMRSIIRQAAMGYLPVADSALSITASVPPNTAVATSLASARVGRGDSTIDCNISVATITGFLWVRQ